MISKRQGIVSHHQPPNLEKLLISVVYNIIMDFAFAFFPWWITWKLDMKKSEKIGLCVTMSLGVV